MPQRNTLSRAEADACAQVLAQLKDDHKRVKKAYQEFQKLEGSGDTAARTAIVEQVLEALTAHASIEEELLYPAARNAIDDTSLIDEAEVEHEGMRRTIEQLRGMSPEDEKYDARFTVLCEYVLHHVKEEEGEMFPKLEHVRMGWEDLAQRMSERREQLMADVDAETTIMRTLGGGAAARSGGSSARSGSRSGTRHH